MKYLKTIYLIPALAILYMSCSPKITTKPNTETSTIPTVETPTFIPNYQAPEWTKDAVLYEVNIRQYTKEGTFKAFQEHLPRIKELGIDILWLMPIYPIGTERRKGDLGSPYSILDYKKVNPDFGTESDFQNLVDATHELGMKLILDWVPNHSSFDNHWAKEHPEWYTKDSLGNITHPPGTDWTDVADLNYDNTDMKSAMTESMLHWVTKYNIDGFRCDVAGNVPNEFWSPNNKTLQEKKHLFLLAEAEQPDLHQAGFHATYGWEMHHIMNEIAKGNMNTIDLDKFLLKDMSRFKKADYRLNFITNHDENSWNGTITERMGNAGDVMAVLAFTIQGMPLIYGGQEAGLNKRLSFFGKDEIDWSDTTKSDFYKRLIDLKHNNKALWAGRHGGLAMKLITDNNKNIFAFTRKKGNNEILVVLNLSNKVQTFKFKGFSKKGGFTNMLSKKSINLESYIKDSHKLDPWGYEVYYK